MLVPLTKVMSIKPKFKWTQVEQDNFNKIKRIVDCNNLSTYPDFSETFKINTDASAFQLGAVISREGKPISCYRRKLTGTQQRYTVTDREILSIHRNPEEF